MKKNLSFIIPSKVLKESKHPVCVLANKHQHMIDQMISECGPEELWAAAEQLRKAALNDVNGSMKQIKEDQEAELAWIRKQ